MSLGYVNSLLAQGVGILCLLLSEALAFQVRGFLGAQRPVQLAELGFEDRQKEAEAYLWRRLWFCDMPRTG